MSARQTLLGFARAKFNHYREAAIAAKAVRVEFLEVKEKSYVAKLDALDHKLSSNQQLEMEIGEEIQKLFEDTSKLWLLVIADSLDRFEALSKIYQAKVTTKRTKLTTARYAKDVSSYKAVCDNCAANFDGYEDRVPKLAQPTADDWAKGLQPPKEAAQQLEEILKEMNNCIKEAEDEQRKKSTFRVAIGAISIAILSIGLGSWNRFDPPEPRTPTNPQTQSQPAILPPAPKPPTISRPVNPPQSTKPPAPKLPESKPPSS
jgi:hypothetical protein